jgi:hypothetical protein
MYDSMLVSPQAKSKGEINVIRKMLRLEEEEEKGDTQYSHHIISGISLLTGDN